MAGEKMREEKHHIQQTDVIFSGYNSEKKKLNQVSSLKHHMFSEHTLKIKFSFFFCYIKIAAQLQFHLTYTIQCFSWNRYDKYVQEEIHFDRDPLPVKNCLCFFINKGASHIIENTNLFNFCFHFGVTLSF